jgi:hypothetical protein
METPTPIPILAGKERAGWRCRGYGSAMTILTTAEVGLLVVVVERLKLASGEEPITLVIGGGLEIEVELKQGVMSPTAASYGI